MKHWKKVSRERLDFLTDGVFAITMTLLVIEMRIPEAFKAATGSDLLHEIDHLRGHFIAFVITFCVLGIRWLSLTRLPKKPEEVSASFAYWSLAHLFFICCMPFTTMLLGRFPGLGVSVWFYALGTILAALAAIRVFTLAEPRLPMMKNEKVLALWWLIGSAVLSVAVSFYRPQLATIVYALNILPPLLARRFTPK